MRKLTFYARLAAQNLRKNSIFYGPNLLACSLCTALLYIIRFLTYSDMVRTMRGGATINTMLALGTLVLTVMVLSILIYANGFIMKRRQKELGLYNILGMEKRQVGHVLILESFFMAVLSVVLGLATGILFSKLALMGLLRLLQFDVPLGFSICLPGMMETASIIGLIFLLLILRNLWILHLSRPVDLLHSGNVGETEPRSRKLMALIGLAALLTGYVMAVTIQNPLTALSTFFIAVILVIIGTYCLFTAVSVVVLKALRKNKRFYYQPRHFTAVSGLLYRMKQNAKGMHNICILMTMLLVTISTTVCLYAGSESSLNAMYPDKLSMTAHLETEELNKSYCEELRESFLRWAEENDLPTDTFKDRLLLEFSTLRTEDGFTTDQSGANLYVSSTSTNLYLLSCMTLGDYNRLTGEALTLGKDEVYCYTDSALALGDTLRLDSKAWHIRGMLPSMSLSAGHDGLVMLSAGIIQVIVPDEASLLELYALQSQAYGDAASRLDYSMTLNPDLPDEHLEAIYKTLPSEIRTWGLAPAYSTSCRAAARYDYYGMNGAFLFLGLFLGLAFLIAAVLMIYYKQISEGYEDRARFVILQKVGMSRSEVRATIRTQVLMIFFLPLLVAAVHVAFAFPMVSKLLLLFGLRNFPLFLLCTLATFLVSALVYVAVYVLTAKKYYQIVKL